jgi:mediator of RNA polymerase II transcription subunit 14
MCVLGVPWPYLFPDFPREPTGITKRYITDEADFRLAYYLVPDPENPDVSKLPSGVVDTPLVRLYNFLREFQVQSNCDII